MGQSECHQSAGERRKLSTRWESQVWFISFYSSDLVKSSLLRLGMLVAYAKEDFGWVRGRVVQVVEEERVTVKLLD